MDFTKVFKSFGLNNIIGNVEILKGGNINQTYLVYDSFNNGYVIQIINKNVFKDPVSVMNNIDLITTHIQNKGFPTLEFLNTVDGKNYYCLDGEYYRIARYIKNSKTVADIDDLHIIKEVGKAYGTFQNCLSDLDSSKLVETIKNFHNTPLRFETLEDTIKQDNPRYDHIKEELNHLLEYKKEVSQIKEGLDSGLIPHRTTHNDTKADNVLFDIITEKIVCVIDLDTVMPGSLLYDFGDSIRSIASKTKEDELNTDNVGLDLEKFRAYSSGFIKKTVDVLTEKEIELLSNSVLTMTVELAVRFYDDYLNNDKYFRISYPFHNLVRARCMLKLADDIYSKMDEMNSILSSLIECYR